MASNNTSLCDGMDSNEAEIYTELKWWLEGVVHLAISIVGLVANSLSMAVMLSSAFNNVFNRTLAGLAFFDGVFNLCDILETIRKIYYTNSNCSAWSYFRIAHIFIFPIVLYPLHKIAMTTSMWTTVVLALNRYSAVSQPISTYVNSATGTAKRVLINISLVLLFSTLFTLPRFFEFYVEWITIGCINNIRVKDFGFVQNETLKEFNQSLYLISRNENFSFDATPDNDSIEMATILDFRVNEFRKSPYYQLYYINIAQNLVTGFIPLILLGVVNCSVYTHLRKRRSEVAQLTKDSRVTFRNGMESLQKSQLTRSLEAENRRQAQTLFGVVALFAVSHVFRVVLNIHEIFVEALFTRVNQPGCVSPVPFWTHIMGTIQRILLAISHSGNLAIYCISSKKFREVLRRTVISIFCKEETTENQAPSNFQMTTYITTVHHDSKK